MEAVKKYDVHLDSKNRMTLRGAEYSYYHVQEFENGCILLEPRVLMAPERISPQTMRAMDRAIENFNAGNVSDAIDLSDF